MRVDTPKANLWLIGDPHLGRDFRNGTPLHRRGEREAMQRQQFQTELATPDVDIVVMVGDLFDKPFVPLPILSQAVHDIVAAAQDRPRVEFVFMAGNHDRSRQLQVDGVWEVFRLAVGWLDNVTVLDQPMAIRGVMFYPWQWDVNAVEQVERFGSVSCSTAVGHWDLMDFGGDTSHMAPVAHLRALNPEVQIYSGHYHEEGVFEVAGVDVTCTGSMQPYTHAEDPSGDLYVTLTLEEALERDDLHDKCVRILLQPGEVLPELDCLQLTQKRTDGDADEVELNEIGVGAFNLAEVLEEQFAEHEVPDEVRTFIKERMGAAS